MAVVQRCLNMRILLPRPLFRLATVELLHYKISTFRFKYHPSTWKFLPKTTMFSGVEQPKRGRGRPPKPKAPAAESIPLVKPRLLLSDDEDDDYQPNWAATGVGFSQVVRHIGAEAHLHKEVGYFPHIFVLKTMLVT